jgi:hypothetical protein
MPILFIFGLLVYVSFDLLYMNNKNNNSDEKNNDIN